MSPEGQRYIPIQAEKLVVKKDQPYSKTEGYKNWGMTTNKRMSANGNWRK